MQLKIITGRTKITEKKKKDQWSISQMFSTTITGKLQLIIEQCALTVQIILNKTNYSGGLKS